MYIEAPAKWRKEMEARKVVILAEWARADLKRQTIDLINLDRMVNKLGQWTRPPMQL